MKVYNLTCGHHHRFEGWFSSEEDFNEQTRSGRIACPVCDSSAVKRLPAAPHLSLSSTQSAKPDVAAEMQAHLRELVRKVVANTEDVGDRFADEARRIHYQEAPERAIRGVASVQECVALAEEGIDVTPLAMPASSKETLQ